MAKVAILMGSKSDLKYWEESKKYMEYFNIAHDVLILSAHRTPEEVEQFARNARREGYSAIIAGAGMAAHLAGAVAANTDLPVLGVMKRPDIDLAVFDNSIDGVIEDIEKDLLELGSVASCPGKPFSIIGSHINIPVTSFIFKETDCLLHRSIDVDHFMNRFHAPGKG